MKKATGNFILFDSGSPAGTNERFANDPRCLEICATYGKDKALDQILQILDRQRGLREYLDMVDEDGRTALMVRTSCLCVIMSAQRAAVSCLSVE